MNFFSSQVVQSTPKIQSQGGVPFGRIISPHSGQFYGGVAAMPSPMMRSNLSVFQSPPQNRQLHSQQDLGQYLRSPQQIQKPLDQQQQGVDQLRRPLNQQQHFIQPHYINSNAPHHPVQKLDQQNLSTQANKLQRQTSFYQQPLQNSRLTMQSLPAHNANQTFTGQPATSERLLNRNLSPQPQQRLNSLMTSPVQRALSPSSQRGGGNPYLMGAQTLYSPSSRVQSPSIPHQQGYILSGRNSLSNQTYYSSGQNFYNKANSFPAQQQVPQTAAYKLELPKKIQDNQQKMNEAIAKSENIKKLVAEKQLQMKLNEQKRQEILDVSKLHDLTPHQTAEKIKPHLSPQKYEESPIKNIQQQIQNVIETKKNTSSFSSNNNNNNTITSIVNRNADYAAIGTVAPHANNNNNNNGTIVSHQEQSYKKQLYTSIPKLQQSIDEGDLTLNQLNENQAQFRKLQQEFKQASNRIKDITQPQLQNTPISLLQKGNIKEKQPDENKENYIIATPVSVQQGGEDSTASADIKQEFKSTVNQFRKSFQKNMYQTPLNNKKKFQKKIYDNEDEYQGGMDNDNPNGYGILKDKHGQEIYKGDWKLGQFDGSGILLNRNPSDQVAVDYKDLSQIISQKQWIKYEGDMKQNEIQGFGTMHFQDNTKLVGNFESSIPHGQGSFYYSDGKSIAAIWDKGQLVEVLWS